MGNLILIVSAVLLPLIWLVPSLMGMGDDLGHGLQSLFSGLSIVAAAFLLGWATELAEEDLPPSFALIVLALVAVLPEYAVDMTFAWEAGKDPSFLPYAVANMTGANRVLIGLGWSSLVFVRWLKTRETRLQVDPGLRMELGFLLLATLYSFVLPIKGTISVLDSIVFVAIFAGYVGRALGSEGEHHDLVGPAKLIDSKVGDGGRRITALFFLVYACFTIWRAAHPFANGLVHVGRSYGIDEFVLIQLVAPLASEAPEFIVAILFVLRLRSSTALGALVSSKVNQWTLLVGMLPIVYGLSLGELTPMVLDARQQSELLLTSAQSLFAITVLSNLRFSMAEASMLAGLYVTAWFFPSEGARAGFSALYLLGAAALGLGTARRREDLSTLLKLWKRHD